MQKPLQHFLMYVPPASVVLLWRHKTKKGHRSLAWQMLGTKRLMMLVQADESQRSNLQRLKTSQWSQFGKYKQNRLIFASLWNLLVYTNAPTDKISPWDFFTFNFRLSYSEMTTEDLEKKKTRSPSPSSSPSLQTRGFMTALHLYALYHLCTWIWEQEGSGTVRKRTHKHTDSHRHTATWDSHLTFRCVLIRRR